ncbi:MAG: hypothetical protein ACNS60_09595 [Candidatus Cyclobacteriaceae bacterium M2_1C_046]
MIKVKMIYVKNIASIAFLLVSLMITTSYAQTEKHELNIGYGEPSFGHIEYNRLIKNHSFGISAGSSIALGTASVRSLIINYKLYWGKANIDSYLPKFYYSPSVGIIFLSDQYGNFENAFSHSLLGITNNLGVKFFITNTIGLNIDTGIGIYSGNIYDSWGCYACDDPYQPLRISYKFQLFHKF